MKTLFTLAESHPKLFAIYFIAKIVAWVIGLIIAITLLFTVMSPFKTMSQVKENHARYEETKETISEIQAQSAEVSDNIMDILAAQAELRQQMIKND